jgi:hypothetical protein
MMSRTGGVEVTMNPRLRFFTHHFKGCQFPWHFDVNADRRWDKKNKGFEPLQIKRLWASGGELLWVNAGNNAIRKGRWCIGLTKINFLEKQDQCHRQISSGAWHIWTEQKKMLFIVSMWRDPRWRMMVLESKSTDETLRSEIIERAPFTCDCRKWKVLKPVSRPWL